MLVNALTIPTIVHILRLNQTSESLRQTMFQIIKELKLKQNEMIQYLKKNPILATADWLFVQKTIDVKSPYDVNRKEEVIDDNYFLSRRHIDQIKCDHCRAHVTIPISKLEFKQTFEDCRVRILRLALEVSSSNTVVRIENSYKNVLYCLIEIENSDMAIVLDSMLYSVNINQKSYLLK